MSMKLEDLKVVVNYRTWPQPFLKAMHTAGFTTPFDYIVSFSAGTKFLEQMDQWELMKEFARLAQFAGDLKHHRARELVERFPTQWQRAPISAPAKAFAIDVIHQLRKIAGEE